MSCDVNTMLANAVSEWTACADRADREASEAEAEAKRLDATTPGYDLGRPFQAAADTARRDSAWYRLRAQYAARGQYLLDPTRLPDPREQALQGACARERRLVFSSATEAYRNQAVNAG